MEAPLATVRPVFRRTAKSLSYPRLPELSLILSDAPFYGRTVLRSIMRLSICAQMSRSEEHTSELQSQSNLVCRLLLEKKSDQTDLVDLPRTDLSVLDLHDVRPPHGPARAVHLYRDRRRQRLTNPQDLQDFERQTRREM